MSKRRVVSPKKIEAKAPNQTILTARFIRPDDYFVSFLDHMPNPDEVLKDTHEAISVYRSMKSDPRVKSLLKVAKSAILNYPLVLDQSESSDAVYDFVSTQGIAKVQPYQIAKRLLSSLDFGFAVGELVWEQADGWWLPADIVARKQDRFAFNAEGRLKLIDRGASVDLYDQSYKWLVHRHDKDAENPYGTSVLSSCYWAWKFKKAGAEFWIMATEKFAVPSLLALFESTENEDRTRVRAQELAAMLMQTQSGSGGAMANIKQVMEVGAAERISEFKTLMDWCDTQIAYGIVYQSLSVQEAENGTRAQATVHQGTFNDAVKLDCRDLAETLQLYIDWIVELNYGPDEPAPKIQFDLDDYASWDQVRDAIDRSIPVSKQALYSRYGLPEPEDDADAYIKPAASSSLGFGLADSAGIPAPEGKKKVPEKKPRRCLTLGPRK